jgi:hypothetical protein
MFLFTPVCRAKSQIIVYELVSDDVIAPRVGVPSAVTQIRPMVVT